ncbi:MAG: peptide ABC transporter substrate-binding protein [Proteobacteria bacterium]|nr:MAG: peptide ABC transporter substrate-binding protein [Pseudomonadota bacterium]
MSKVSRGLALWLILGLLAGCSNGARPLKFNLGIESTQLDWNKAIDATSVVLLDNVMEGLTTYSAALQGYRPDLLRPLPALAASWSVSEGGRVYRFHLRPGITWTDGQPLVAQAFVDSWQRLLNPETRSANAYHLFDIENARAYNEGRLKSFSSVGVRALDELTLEVHLRRQAPYFLHLVASASTFPVRRDLIERFGDAWANPDNLVTLGPYQISEFSPGDRVVLRAFSEHHLGLPPIREVICRLVAEPLTAYALFENGELDILPRDLPPSFAKRLLLHPDYRTGPRLSVSYLLFNTKRAPFDTPSRRRAFIQAMDRAALSNYFEGTQVPTRSWIPPGLLGHTEAVGVRADALANGSLHAREPVELRYSGSDTWNLVFQAVQRQMKEKLGLTAKLNKVESTEYGDYLSLLSLPRKGAEALPQLNHLGWVADYPDPHSFMNVFTSTSESNYTGWSNPRYDRLVERAVATENEGVRAALYTEAQRILLEEEAVLMPLFYTSHQALVRSELKGVQLNVLDKWYFRNMEFQGSGWRGFGRSFLKRLSPATSREG